MELILWTLLGLFVALLALLVFFFEVELAWAAGIATSVALALCAIAIVVLRSYWIPKLGETVRWVSGVEIALGFGLLAVAGYALFRLINIRRRKHDKAGRSCGM